MIIEATKPEAIDRTVAALLRGDIVAFPTDTVYGLAAALTHPAAVNSLYEVKQRPDEKAIPVLIASLDDLGSVATMVEPAVLRFLAPFWPGPLTIVLPARDNLPDAVTSRTESGRRTVAVRVPDHRLARAIIKEAGGALAATSANASGQPPGLTAQEVQRQLATGIDIILDGGPAPGGVASTIVELRPDGPRILRAGGLPTSEIQWQWQAVVSN